MTGVALGVLVLGSVAPPSAQALPSRDLAQVEEQVLDLEMQAGAAHERAQQARMQLGEVQRELSGMQDRLKRKRQAMREVQATIQGIARSMYMSGFIDPTLEVLLAEDPAAFLSQAALVQHLSQSQQDVLRGYRTKQLQLAQAEAAIADRRKLAQQRRSEMAAAEAQVKERLAAAEKVLSSLQAKERRRLFALERQRRMQQAAEARQQARQVGSSSVSNSRIRSVIKYALSQVGRPYSFSANPPSSWDCSKLTTAAWRQAGVGLTALSYRQWDQTRRVPVSQIRPGDLVFYFGRGAHHVALYIGNGKMVSASNPRDGVEIIGFLSPWYRERFSGVGRVL
ncbi:MAG: C40 family peptidase [Actinomycetales bacterium]|nr:C40 family peptidase [Actinomycetales bacterium]